MKTSINVKSIYVPRFTFNWLWFAIAAFIRQFTTDENDKAIRELMCELTADEARDEILSTIANEEQHKRDGEWWSSG